MQINVTIKFYELQDNEEYHLKNTLNRNVFIFSEYEAILYLKKCYIGKLIKIENILLIETKNGVYALWKDRIRFLNPNPYTEILTPDQIKEIFRYDQVKRRDLDKQLVK